MGIRIPVEDSAPSVASEGAVASVFEALGEAPEFRDPRGKQIDISGTLAPAVVAMTAGHTSCRRIETYGKLREETLIPLLGFERAPSGYQADRPGRRPRCNARCPPGIGPRSSVGQAQARHRQGRQDDARGEHSTAASTAS